jgi:glutaredoxin
MKKIILVVLIVIIAAYLLWQLSASPSVTANPNAEIIFFYGSTCPHCKNVEDYFAKNKVEEKVAFEKAEVYGNKENAKIFVEKNKACGVTDEKEMGVPLLWVNGKCYSGEKEIIDFFNSKINAN